MDVAVSAQPNDKPIYLGQILVIVPLAAGVILTAFGRLRGAPPLLSVIDLIRLRVPSPADVDYILPRPLVLTNPWEIGSALIAMLTFPPLPWLHAWLIGQAYRYIFPIDETHKAMRLALSVSAILTILAVPLALLWLTTEQITYGAAIGVAAIMTTTLSVIAGVREARRRHFTNMFVWKLALVTALLALIIPLCLAVPLMDDGRFFPSLGWCAILAALIGFIRCRRVLTAQVERFQARASLWHIDRLALEITLIGTVFLLPFGEIAAVQIPVLTQRLLIDDPHSPSQFVVTRLAIFVVLAAAVVITGAGIVVYTRRRGNQWVLKKRDPLSLHEAPLLSGSAWHKRLIIEMVIWLGAAVILFAMVGGVIGVSTVAFFTGITHGG